MDGKVLMAQVEWENLPYRPEKVREINTNTFLVNQEIRQTKNTHYNLASASIDRTYAVNDQRRRIEDQKVKQGIKGKNMKTKVRWRFFDTYRAAS